ncbi:MAG: FHA domain-containing protein [Bdellovibrionales bacterium]|nr:FHA domain-containing protein [Bdellovibrionales bacterium]
MFILKLTYKGTPPIEYLLTEDRDLWVGRNKKNFIVLKASYGISREHLKISKSDDESWKVECVSKLGGLLFKGKQVSECHIKTGDTFSLQDYHFELIPKPADAQPVYSQDNTENQPIDELKEKESTEEEKPQEKSEESLSLEKDEQETPEEPSEDPFEKSRLSTFEEASSEPSMMTEAATVMTTLQNQLKPYLVISLSEDEEDQTAALEHGDKWVVGRDPSCDICVEDINISRQHFYITKKDSQYFITDLGSSNGTYVDDKLLKPNEPFLLKSGAVISVLEIEMYFEVRNPKIEKKISNLPALADENISPPPQNDPDHLPLVSDAPPPAIHQPTPNVIMSDTIITPIPPSQSSSKKRIFLIIAVLAVVGAGLFFSQENKNNEKEQAETSDSSDPFRVLDPETQGQVKDLYALAEQQYHMKKFELCYQTLEKMHALVPYYDQSKSLIITCQNGAESVRMQKELEVSRRKEQENKKAMSENIEFCKSKFDTFESMGELTECLHKARTIDPENSEIAFLISKFETKEMLTEERRLARIAQKRRVDVLLNEYNKVKELKEQNNLLKAIPAYKKFLSKKHPSEIAETIQTAQEELTAMEEEVNSKTQSLLDNCQQLIDAKNYKEAYIVCQKVFTVAPAHSTASTHIQTAVEAINESLKPLYNESVLNESLGQIEIAKKQWQSIMDQDIPNGEYYTKAEKKLSKY